jgi:spore coat protein U-like protein
MTMDLRQTIAALAMATAAGYACATPQCTVSSSATLSFGAVVALASTGDVNSDTGSSFWVNCNAEVTSPPAIYSSDVRAMTSGGRSLPFTLSVVAPGSTPLPSSSPGTPLAIARNGTNQVVTLYGKIRAADFKMLPGGVYTTSILMTIEY